MARGDRERVDDILEAIDNIRKDMAGLDADSFAANPVVVRSVLYSISVIGESVKNLSTSVTATHPEIPWRAIASLRDRIVHEYFRTNTRRIWDVVSDDLDELERVLRWNDPKA